MNEISKTTQPLANVTPLALAAIVLLPALLIAQQLHTVAVSSIDSARMITGRFGPYGGISTADDARQLNIASFNLVLPGSFMANLRADLFGDGAAFIDPKIWALIDEKCSAQVASKKAMNLPPGCDLTPADQEEIATAAKMHLEEVKTEPGLVGVWILDDYPQGDITAVLKTLHGLVHAAGASVGRNLPTICGLGGSLDLRDSTHESFKPQHKWIDQPAINVTPAACDYVAPYFYGSRPQPNPDLVDWSMRDVIPYALQVLRAKGFNTSGILIPILDAFGSCERSRASGTSCYVTPRPQDILAQAKAWTEAGAVAMMFFTWHSSDSDENYLNSASIRDGVQQAAAYFRAHHH
jgi:hypothetical protein